MSRLFWFTEEQIDCIKYCIPNSRIGGVLLLDTTGVLMLSDPRFVLGQSSSGYKAGP